MSNFGSVELNIEKPTGSSIASQTYMPTINIGNVASNNFGNPEQQAFEFDITEQGAYTIAVYSAASEWSDCIIGQLILTANSYNDTGIKTMDNGKLTMDNAIYDLQGRKISVSNPSSSSPVLRKGIYIKNGKKYVNK
jgi:hypothetical protein